MPLAGSRILVLNDSIGVGGLLKAAHAETRAAISAADALRSILGWVPHAVVSDLTVSRMDACGFMREVRDVFVMEHMAALAITDGSDALHNVAFMCGYHATLAKPFAPEVLTFLVRHTIRRASGQTHLVD